MKRMKKIWLLFALTLFAVCCFALSACGNAVVFKFDTDGGEEIAAVECQKGEEYTLPTPAARTGYEFEGWYLTEDFSGAPVVSQTAEEDLTFYAKWTKLYLVTLDVGSGTLSERSFYLKAGENLADALEDRVPTREDFLFGCWQKDGKDLGAGERMPQEDITLTAKYQVKYTVEVYEQALDDPNEYEKAAEPVVGYAYADGQEFTPTVDREGFTLTTHEGNIRSKVLTETPSQNLFRLYFDRSEVTVLFDGNGAEGERTVVTGKYGQTIDLPTDLFVREGYLLLGWSASQTGGEPMYIPHEVFNEEAGEPVEYTLSSSVVLYAVWQQGYVDLFGGSDLIYIVNDEAYLERAGFLFAGEQRGNRALYTFSAENKILLTCKVYDDGTFCYSDSTRASFSASLYSLEENALSDTITLYFTDEFNGLSYSVKDSGGKTDTSSGTYVLDEYGYYHTQFTSGSMRGKDFVFVVDSVQSENGTYVNVFIVRNEEEYELGVLTMFVSVEGSVFPYDEDFLLMLDGFGNAALTYNGSILPLYYTMDTSIGTEVLVLYLSENEVFGTFVIIEEQGVKGYIYFDPTSYGTFKEENGNGNLTLDGVSQGTFMKGATRVSGYYTATESVTGATIVTLVSGTQTYVFAVWSESDESGEEYEYYYEQYDSSYAELLYSGDTIGYPLLIMGTEGNEFTLYMPDASGAYLVPVLEGTVSAHTGEGAYLATVTDVVTDAGLAPSEVDYTSLKSFVFSIGIAETSEGYMSVMYWWAYTTNDNETVGLKEEYSAQEGSGKLVIVGGFAFYTDAEGTEHVGTWQTDDLCCILSDEEGDVIFFKLIDEGKTFVLLDYDLLGYAYLVTEGGEAAPDNYLMLDGLGGAVYFENAGSDAEISTEGKIALTDKDTEFGDDIYQFTSDGKTFELILYTDGTYLYFSVKSETYFGEYKTAAGDTITLDGFSSFASYESADGSTYFVGTYYLYEENLIRLTGHLEDGTAVPFFFEVENRTVTQLGSEFGECAVVENQSIRDEYYSFDGHGKLTVIVIEGEGDDSTEKTVAEGEYSRREDGAYVLTYTYTGKSQTTTIVGSFGVLRLEQGNVTVFIVYYEEVVNVYLNEADWSVLVLDGFGSAERILANGLLESGSYVVISEELIYYCNDDATDACLYEYDAKNGRIVALDFGETGYYTEDLDALLFTSYGFVVYHDETLCFYYLEDDDSVTLYYAAEDLEDVEEDRINRYGYVAVSDFGKFNDTITFENKTYHKNEGFAISFERKAGETAYPIPLEEGNVPLEDLTFAPSDGDFTTIGAVLLTTESGPMQASCYVVRETDDSGNTQLYLLFATTGNGYFRYDITVEYRGEKNSTYSVTGMSAVEEYYSAAEVELYLYLSQLGMAGSITDFSTIRRVIEFDTQGVAGEVYIEADFTELAGYYDVNGDPIEGIDRADCIDIEYYGYSIATFRGSDGYTYHLYFAVEDVDELGVSVYSVLAFTREQQFDVEGDQYKVVTERIIGTDSDAYAIGELLMTTLLEKSEEGDWQELYFDYNFIQGLTEVFIVEDDYDSVKETHYIVSVKDLDWSSEYVVPLFESVTVTVKEARVYYDASQRYAVAIYEDEGKIAYLLDYFAESYYPVMSCELIAADTYAIETADGAHYTVKIEGNTVTVTSSDTN